MDFDSSFECFEQDWLKEQVRRGGQVEHRLAFCEILAARTFQSCEPQAQRPQPSLTEMPQGVVKPKASAGGLTSSNKTAHSARARSKANPAKTASNAPKNAKAAKLQKQARKGQGGLTSTLEKKLAERAGHTEMIGARGGVRKNLSKKELEKERKSGGAGAARGSFKKG